MLRTREKQKKMENLLRKSRVQANKKRRRRSQRRKRRRRRKTKKIPFCYPCQWPRKRNLNSRNRGLLLLKLFRCLLFLSSVYLSFPLSDFFMVRKSMWKTLAILIPWRSKSKGLSNKNHKPNPSRFLFHDCLLITRFFFFILIYFFFFFFFFIP